MYTTGFNLDISNDELWQEIMRLDKLRLSIHSSHPTTYSEITGLPEKVRPLEKVCEHINYLIQLRENQTSQMPKVGIGFVILPMNYEQIVDIAEFASNIGVDFLNIRKDEVDVTENLSSDELSSIRKQLFTVRQNYLNGMYGKTHVDMSDELTHITNGTTTLNLRGGECYAKFFRPTIGPFGSFAPCDLKAEPRFANNAFEIGDLHNSSLMKIVESAADKYIADSCAQCMPSSRTGNAIYRKLIDDSQRGIAASNQPFNIQPQAF